jgi:2-methylcitrate dehydratase PrpD
MGKPFHAGKAASDGLLAAFLAQKGFSAPLDILDPDAGFCRVFSDEYKPDRLLKAIGEKYHVLDDNFKPYAACLLAHPVIDGLIRLKREHAFAPEAINEVRVRVNGLNLKVAGDPEPTNALKAKFSIPMAAALALIHGRVAESMFTDEMVREPHVREMMGKVKASADNSLAETEAKVTVVRTDGQIHSVHVLTPKGDPRNPMTFAEIAEKMRDTAGNVLSDRAIDKIVTAIEALERTENITRLVRLCCPAKSRNRSTGTG